MTQRHREHRDTGTARPRKSLEELNQITGQIIDTAVKIHVEWGPGLAERAYEKRLTRDLRRSGKYVERQPLVSFDHEKAHYLSAFRPDLIVDRCIIVEIKARPYNHATHTAQLMTYLKLTGCRLGLVLNFGMPRLKDGIRRVINGY